MFLLQSAVGLFPSPDDLLNQASKLNRDSKDLKTKAVSAAEDLKSELEAARMLEADAEQVRDEMSLSTQCSKKYFMKQTTQHKYFYFE